jgi:hypothetical protein
MPLQLSQSALARYDSCARKFQYTHWDQLGELMSADQRSNLEWGSRFHQLMQQRDLGLPVVAHTFEDQSFQRCAMALVAAAPHLFDSAQWRDRLSEHRRTLALEGAVLTVIYDLLLLGDRQAEIIDWKTYPRPLQANHLAHHWQTRLYLFLLAETSDYTPDQIRMTYWFVQPLLQDPHPQSITLTYSQGQHDQTRQDLIQRIHQLTDYLAAYPTGPSLPQRPEDDPTCQTCPFALRCQRGDGTTAPLVVPSLNDIAEVSL